MCNGCRRWYRQHERLTQLRPDIAEVILTRGDEDDGFPVFGMREMLARLTAAQRDLLHRHYYKGETAREIAASTGRSLKSTEKRIVVVLRRAREFLR